MSARGRGWDVKGVFTLNHGGAAMLVSKCRGKQLTKNCRGVADQERRIVRDCV